LFVPMIRGTCILQIW